MKRIIIEIKEETHRNIKVFCFKHGITMKDYITGLLEKDQKERREADAEQR